MKPEIKAGQVWKFDDGTVIIKHVGDRRITLDETFKGVFFKDSVIFTDVIYRLINDEDWVLLPNSNEIWKELCLK